MAELQKSDSPHRRGFNLDSNGAFGEPLTDKPWDHEYASGGKSRAMWIGWKSAFFLRPNFFLDITIAAEQARAASAQQSVKIIQLEDAIEKAEDDAKTKILEVQTTCQRELEKQTRDIENKKEEYDASMKRFFFRTKKFNWKSMLKRYIEFSWIFKVMQFI